MSHCTLEPKPLWYGCQPFLWYRAAFLKLRMTIKGIPPVDAGGSGIRIRELWESWLKEVLWK